ncbi:MAG: acetyl-CoA carboxylase biotin carboxyl carrier protein [Puniceicoccales bacterium]|nr:acetyl-CoA carboxylase biotin carboxyl carrier protein [Puniceicoccales bacterium]
MPSFLGDKEGCLDTNEIKELAKLMESSKLSEIEIQRGDTRIRLKMGHYSETMDRSVTVEQLHESVKDRSSSSMTGDAVMAKKNLYIVKSPMVGTFYNSPSPDSSPFVVLGSNVERESVLCILEAMKIMNEIQSDVSGVVQEILVSNGQAVEFGQPLFAIELN